MRCSYVLRNPFATLRPVRLEDAEFIVKLRNEAHVRGCVNDTSLDVDRQRQWIKGYLERENEHYWIVEHGGVPYATQSLYNFDPVTRQIESGRWVRSRLAPEGANIFAGRIQMNDFVFRTLKMKSLVYDVVSTNKHVLNYHRLCGGIETGIEHGKFVIQGKPTDMIWFKETSDSWDAVRPKLCRLAGISPDESYGQIEQILI